MFETREQLASEIVGLLDTLVEVSGGDEACLLEPKGLLFGSGSGGSKALSEFLEARCGPLFAIPEGLAQDGPREDLFEPWTGPSVLLAFINRRVAVALSCPDAQEAEGRIQKPLRALVDRVLRYDAKYRLDPDGRGLFVGRPRLDLVVVGPSEAHPA
jgi:hypothetical protein